VAGGTGGDGPAPGVGAPDAAGRDDGARDVEDAVGRIADELYGLPPDAFVPARDDHVARARESGERDLVKALGRLRRPTRAAWLANLLARHRAEQVDGLVDLATGLAQAQRSLDGDMLRALSSTRHRLVAAMAREAGRLARDRGEPVTDAVLRDLQGILEAALARPDVAAQVRSGRLTRTVSYSGFGPEDLTSVGGAGGAEPAGRGRPGEGLQAGERHSSGHAVGRAEPGGDGGPRAGTPSGSIEHEHAPPARRRKSDHEQAEREGAERDRAERDRAERDRAQRERAERERAERERAERERAERERALADAERAEGAARERRDADAAASDTARDRREAARERVAALVAELETARDEERAAAEAARAAASAARGSARAATEAATRTARARARLDELEVPGRPAP
jgi:hypothetical protein